MNKYKILVADDDQMILDFITQILEDENYKIYSALNGKIAYDLAVQYLPDLIIIDWNMPELNGIETLKILKKNQTTNDIPVIIITGIMNSKENLKEAFDAGAIDYISKPIDHIELVSRTRSMLMLADYYKQTILHKDWELTLLAKNVLRNNEFNLKLLMKLEDLKKNPDCNFENSQQTIDELITELKYYIKDQAWEQFESYFKSVHPNFVKNLLTKYPILTTNDIKLCVLLRLNLNSKEIASITFKNSHSIDIARYRLRKKMKLKRSDKLTLILMKI